MNSTAEMKELFSSVYENSIEFIFNFGPKVIGALLVYFVGSILIKKLVSFIGYKIDTSKIDTTLAPFFKNMAYTLLKVLLVISVVGIVGVETTSLAAVIAAAGLAVGLALQGSLGNFAGGVLLLIFRPIEVGDVIKAQGYEGQVTEILLFVTVLKTLDNRVIYIPNGPLAGGPIENFSREEWRRVDMDFKINGDQNINAVREIMILALNSVPGVTLEPKAQVVVTSVEEYAVVIQARPYCRPEDYYDVFVGCQEAIKKAFTKTGIKSPLPNQNVYVHHVAGQKPSSASDQIRA